MKSRWFYQSVVIFIILHHSIVTSQTSWIYPVRPGTPEWNSLITIEERRAAQQIPDDILNNMSTYELLNAWLDLPGRLEVLAFNSLQQGFNETVKYYNVLPELLDQHDVGSVVMNYYESIDPSMIRDDRNEIEIGKFITDIGFIEFLLSQQEILNKLNQEEKRTCIEYGIDKYRKKQSLESRASFWEETNIIMMGRVMRNAQYEKFLNWITQDPSITRALNEGEISIISGGFDPYFDIINIAEAYLSK